MEEKLFILNIFFYIFCLVFLNNFLKNSYIFPFRSNDIINFLINAFIFGYFNFINFGLYILISNIILNLCLLYIFFHLLNMINTSSRTKIILDVYRLKKIKISKYKNIYNEKIIMEKRLKRLLSSNQIIIEGNKIKLKTNTVLSSKIINFVLNFLKKI
tara:strand:+ start:202 stop:675 length:474 start_codon:yes stop_codon:yes gene_type:complete